MEKVTNNCLHYEELISNYLDEELEGKEIQELEVHLGTCKKCKKFYNLCQRVDENVETFLFAKKTRTETESRKKEINKSSLDLLGLGEEAANVLVSNFLSFSEKSSSEGNSKKKA